MADSMTRRLATLVFLSTLGLSVVAQGADLIPFESNWLYLHPNGTGEDPGSSDNDFDTTWFSRTYNTSSPNAWAGPSQGPFSRGGISAFDPTNSRFVREANTLLTEYDSGNRLTAYFRHEFTTTEESSGFALEMLADDGAKVYLDGNEILALNCCVNVAPGQPASYENLAITVGDERAYNSYRVMQGQTLASGNHVLAVAVHNRSATDSDLGFSLRFTEGLVDFVTAGDQWNYFEGLEEPSNGTLDWTLPEFDDGSWSTGKEAFGYEESAAGDPNGVFDMVDPATLLDMQDSYTTLYIRKPFSVGQIDDLGQLTLTMDYDDGFFAYINGQLVFSSEDPHPLGDPTLPIPFDTEGGTLGIDHESTNNSASLPEVFTVNLADFPGLLNEGDNNVLAIQGVNTALTSSDFLLAKISLFGSPAVAGPSVPGDFNGDGALTAADIDLLSAEVRKGSTDTFYDVTGDGKVDDADRTEWVETLKFTYFGDSDLDLQFSSADLVTVLVAGEYEDATPGNSSWATGDWNGDGEFDTADFVTALGSGGYEAGPRAAVAAVPEPSSVTLVALAMLAAGSVRRRRGN